jgi:hypothetical protein
MWTGVWPKAYRGPRKNLTQRRKEKADLTEGHKAASPRPNTKKSFTQQGHKDRKEIPYQELKTDCSLCLCGLRGLVVNYSIFVSFVIFCEISVLCGFA